MELGLFESLLTSGLVKELGQRLHLQTDIRGIDAAAQPLVLARHIQRLVERALVATKDAALPSGTRCP